MPSPFPGMDPYLENVRLWADVNLELISGIRALLNLLSPTNKMSGSAGRKSYSDKCNEVMESSTHLVEIDLLRDGKGFVARERFSNAGYFVFLSRTESERRRNFVWPIDLTQKLPVVEIPLREGDEDAHLDLQSCIEQVYDRGAYQMAIDYKTQPVPALTEQRDTWVDELLRGARMR